MESTDGFDNSPHRNHNKRFVLFPILVECRGKEMTLHWLNGI